METRTVRALRARAHHLKPVVIIGAAGMSDSLMAEIQRALAHHELIKVRVNAEDRVQRDAMIEAMCRRTGADLIQRVGHVAVLYLEKPEEKA